MRKVQLLILILCTLSLGMSGQGVTITSGPEALPDEVNHYAVRGVSDNGRYIYGGWGNPVYVSFVYDTERDKVEVLEAESREGVQVIKVLSDGSVILVYSPQKACEAYIRTPQGQEIALKAPNPDHGLMPSDATEDGKWIIGNSQSLDARSHQPVIGERQSDGTYLFTALPEPDEDLMGCKPQYNKVEAISPDAQILVGRQNSRSGFEMQYIKWTRQTDGSYTYTLPIEKLFINADKPKPGMPPIYDEYVTAEPDTPEYDGQVDRYNKDLEAWTKKCDERTGQYTATVMQVTHFSRPQMKFCTALYENSNDDSGMPQLRPFVWDVTTDSYQILKPESDLALCAFDVLYDGSVVCLSNPGMLFWRAHAVDPKSNKSVPLLQWIKEHSGRDISDFYAKQVDPMMNSVCIGIPRISGDGKTIVFYTMNGNSDLEIEFFNTMIRLLGSAYTANEVPLVYGTNAIEAYINGRNLIISKGALDMPLTIALYDVSGQVVWRTMTQERQISLPVSLPQGEYIARITSPSGDSKAVSGIIR